MMNYYYGMMGGGYGGSMMFFGWIGSILILALIVLGIIALLKYLSKK